MAEQFNVMLGTVLFRAKHVSCWIQNGTGSATNSAKGNFPPDHPVVCITQHSTRDSRILFFHVFVFSSFFHFSFLFVFCFFIFSFFLFFLNFDYFFIFFIFSFFPFFFICSSFLREYDINPELLDMS